MRSILIPYCPSLYRNCARYHSCMIANKQFIYYDHNNTIHTWDKSSSFSSASFRSRISVVEKERCLQLWHSIYPLKTMCLKPPSPQELKKKIMSLIQNNLKRNMSNLFLYYSTPTLHICNVLTISPLYILVHRWEDIKF